MKRHSSTAVLICVHTVSLTPLLTPSYYDAALGAHPACSALNGGEGWSLPINKNPSACGASIQAINTENVVALNVSWLNQDNMAQRPDLCGRE